MARILPPTVFTANYASPKMEKSYKQNLLEQWSSPQGVKTAVDLTDLVGGTIVDTVERFNRTANKVKGQLSYDEALARVAGARNHLERRKAYEHMQKAYDRPGSGRLTRRFSGGIPETMTTQYKRMLSPMVRPPGRGGKGSGRTFKVKREFADQIRKAGEDYQTAYGDASLTLSILNAMERSGSSEPDPSLLPRDRFVRDAETGLMRYVPPNEMELVKNMTAGQAYDDYIAQNQAIYRNLVAQASRVAGNQAERARLQGIVDDSVNAYRDISTAYTIGTPEAVARLSAQTTDPRSPLYRAMQYQLRTGGQGGSMVNTGSRGGGGALSEPDPLTVAAAGGMTLLDGTTTQPVPEVRPQPTPSGGRVVATPTPTPPTPRPDSPQRPVPDVEAVFAEPTPTPTSEASRAAATAAALVGGIATVGTPTARPAQTPVVSAAPPVPSSEQGMMSTTQDALMSRQLEGARQEQMSRAADEAATFGGQSTEIGRQSREVPRWMRGRGPIRRNNQPDTSAPSRTQERQKTRQQAAKKRTKKKELSKKEQGRRLAQTEYARAGLRRRMKNKQIKKKEWIEAVTKGISAGKSNSAAVRDAEIELGLREP